MLSADNFKVKVLMRYFLLGMWSIAVMSIGTGLPWAKAQVDPSSALLLRSGGSAPSREELDSSRYTVRPEAPVLQQEAEPSSPPPTSSQTRSSTELIETLVPLDQSEEEIAEEDNSSVGDQVRDLVMGGNEQALDRYRGLLHPNDSRNNLIEITVAPIYLYNHSSSNYWYREHFSSSPGILLGTKLWLSPFFGVQGEFKSSFGASIAKQSDVPNRLEATHQWLDLGIRFRRYFGLSRRSPGLIFGLDFSDYQMKVPKISDTRVGTSTTGVRLSVEAILPKSPHYSWVLGGEWIPKGGHKEINTQLDLKSGTGPTSETVGLWFGGQHNFDRYNQVFWKLSHRVENNLFDGQASLADPVTGQQPEGVSVTNSTTIFHFGYTWGK